MQQDPQFGIWPCLTHPFLNIGSLIAMVIVCRGLRTSNEAAWIPSSAAPRPTPGARRSSCRGVTSRSPRVQYCVHATGGECKWMTSPQDDCSHLLVGSTWKPEPLDCDFIALRSPRAGTHTRRERAHKATDLPAQWLWLEKPLRSAASAIDARVAIHSSPAICVDAAAWFSRRHLLGHGTTRLEAQVPPRYAVV